MRRLELERAGRARSVNRRQRLGQPTRPARREPMAQPVFTPLIDRFQQTRLPFQTR